MVQAVLVKLELEIDLYFQVMVQRHNRHMSLSVYISALAVSDTVALILSKSSFYTIEHYPD